MYIQRSLDRKAFSSVRKMTHVSGIAILTMIIEFNLQKASTALFALSPQANFPMVSCILFACGNMVAACTLALALVTLRMSFHMRLI